MNEEVWSLLADSFWKILLPGLTMTIPLTVIAFSLALVIAVAMAMIQFANVKVLKQLARFYIWIFRGTPLLVQLFVVFYGLPNVGILIEPFPAAVLVFSLNEGAYCAESIRAALEAVPAGQMEAGYCADCPASGHAHSLSAPFQFTDSNGKGYLTCGEYHRDGDVYGDPAHRGQNL